MCTTHSLEKARLSMARGICSEAVEALEAVVPFLSYGTVVGGTAFIELGMALEASGKPQKALDIYQKLAKQTGDEAIRKQARPPPQEKAPNPQLKRVKNPCKNREQETKSHIYQIFM